MILTAAALDNKGAYTAAQATYDTATRAAAPEDYTRAQLDLAQAKATLDSTRASSTAVPNCSRKGRFLAAISTLRRPPWSRRRPPMTSPSSTSRLWNRSAAKTLWRMRRGS